MSKELAEGIVENGIVYRLGEHDLYYPELGMPEGSHYNIGKYGLMQCEYLKTDRKREYLRLLLDAKLNEHLHEIDEECHARVELFVEQMKTRSGITEELKSTEQMVWVGLMNNVRSA
ncbi:MAG: TnpV protein [Lachnospiraceae bacterium]|nr:TnpV protein [Lachnospiraceae bacterium]